MNLDILKVCDCRSSWIHSWHGCGGKDYGQALEHYPLVDRTSCQIDHAENRGQVDF